jgi:type III secretion system low calcium response chaperone LcrH/SycD
METMPKKEEKLPGELLIQSIVLSETAIELEEKEYHNDLMPFSQRKEQISAEIKQAILSLYHQLKVGEKILEEVCIEESKGKVHPADEPSQEEWGKFPEVLKESLTGKYMLLNAAQEAESLQVRLNLPQVLLTKGYKKGLQFLQEKKFIEAESLFLLLRHLNDKIFEFWLGLATAQQELSKFHEAIDTYKLALIFDQHKPLLFLQIAYCLLALQEKEVALKALDYCIENAEKDDTAVDILNEAQELKKTTEATH